MSEYQYYEFRAIDRPLGGKQMDELRALSTRAEITPTSFTNEYHWGNFKGDPAKMMDRYFDAFVYYANWGTNELMLRLPRQVLDMEAAECYCDGEVLSIKGSKDHVVLQFHSDADPDDDWTEGEDWMSALVPIREELMRGDLRGLYLGWLASVSERGWLDDEADEEADELEPPVPPGLANLTESQRALVSYLRVDDDLLEAAAAASTPRPAVPSREEMERWIKSLPAADKDAYLVRFLAEEGDIALRAELAKRFRESTASAGKASARAAERRTIAQLLAASKGLYEEKTRQAAEVEARNRARREREEAKARAAYLEQLSRREPEVWREVDALIASKRPKDYDHAVALLTDLQEVASQSGRSEQTVARIRELQQRHANKPSLMERFQRKKLGG
jgi:hypothetical protein